MIQYGANYNIAGTVTSVTPVLTNCTALLLADNNTRSTIADFTGTNIGNLDITVFLTVTGANASFSPGITAGMSSANWADLYVTQIPSIIN